MNTYIGKLYLWVLGAMLLFTSCKEPQVQPGPIDDTGGVEVTVSHSAGNSWTTRETPFLACPVNIATHMDVPILIISDRLAEGSKIEVTLLGAARLKEGGGITTYVLAVPSKVRDKTIDIDDFSDLATIHSSAKWIIEQYLISRNGMGSASLIAWEDQNYVLGKLFKN